MFFPVNLILIFALKLEDILKAMQFEAKQVLIVYLWIFHMKIHGVKSGSVASGALKAIGKSSCSLTIMRILATVLKSQQSCFTSSLKALIWQWKKYFELYNVLLWCLNKI